MEGEREETMTLRIEIRHLLGRRLRMPLVAYVEPANPGFAAHASGISVFGYGDDAAEAVSVLKEGIESICRQNEFNDLRSSVERLLVLDNIMPGDERDAQAESA